MDIYTVAMFKMNYGGETHEVRTPQCRN